MRGDFLSTNHAKLKYIPKLGFRAHTHSLHSCVYFVCVCVYAGESYRGKYYPEGSYAETSVGGCFSAAVVIFCQPLLMRAVMSRRDADRRVTLWRGPAPAHVMSPTQRGGRRLHSFLVLLRKGQAALSLSLPLS